MSNYHTNIKSGDAEVITSGSVITFDQKPLEIEFGNSQETLKIIIEFLNDDKSEAHIQGESLDPKTLKFKLFNFNSSLGTGTTSPIKIGTFNNKQLFMGFVVDSLDKEASKTFHYTLYLYGTT